MPIHALIPPQAKDLGGGLQVRRLLPAVQQRAVGPFVFFDHFGPVDVQPDSQLDVRPHPHIGLVTLSYLFEGAMMHRDSLGVSQRLAPGDLGWMTAGRGIVHSERQPAELRGQHYKLQGMQLWLALPKAHEEADPGFVHMSADRLPTVDLPAARVRVLVGQAFGAVSPVATFSPTLYLDLHLQAGADLWLPALAEEMALYPVDAPLEVDGRSLPAHQMGVLTSDSCRLRAARPARVLVVGGAALDGPRWLWWNFVSSRRERIIEAMQDWREGRFAGVRGDAEFIPLPQRPGPARHPGA